MVHKGLPWWFSSKESVCNVGATRNMSLIPGLARSPGGGHGNSLQYTCLENPRGQRSLVGYSPWSHRVGHDSATKHTQHSILLCMKSKRKREVQH